MKKVQTKAALFGLVAIVAGFSLYLFGVLLGPIRLLLGNPEFIKAINEFIVWYSGVPVVIGIALIVFDFLTKVNWHRATRHIRYQKLFNPSISVALTAYNDELSIADSVKDFLKQPNVKRVIVVSNNSTDGTMEKAEQAGAIVLNESQQGYGACVYRALTEACQYEDSELVLLCEGDCTFSAEDIPKFLSYIDHADIVNGTRIVEKLQESQTQLSTFMHYGNLFVGKLLEAKYLGQVTLTDVGTTYKVCRKEPLRALLPKLNSAFNLTFNPYFLDQALLNGMTIVECPIAFLPRVGESKGGNINNKVAFRLGVGMILGILSDWRFSRHG